MWYSDIQDAVQVAKFFDCSVQTAEAIIEECHRLYTRGSSGAPYSYDINSADSYKVLAAVRAALRHLGYGGVDAYDLAQLFHDAWTDGIQRKNRVTLALTNGECGMVTITVNDRFAEIWADGDGAWEAVSPDYVYAVLHDEPDLVATLRSEGYTIDLSAYEFSGSTTATVT